MSVMDGFKESAKLFREKKAQCVEYIGNVEKLVSEYEKDFPPIAENKNGRNKNDNVSHSRTAVFHEIGEKLKNDRLKILVAGQFKQGKSTLINALLGEEVLPAYATPCTAVITEISYGDKKKAVISFKKQIQELPAGLAKRAKEHIGGRKSDIPDLIIESDNIGEEMEEFLVIPDDEDKEQRDSVAQSPYLNCHLSWPLELCRNEVEIIDSPGLNEAAARDETTYNYVPQADMILHVLSAIQLFGQPDKDFVTKLQSMGAPALLFIVNRFDQLNKDKDRERVRNRALNELTEYTDYGSNGIFFVSSQKALDGRVEQDEDLFRESGFEGFERQIAKVIAKDRVKMKLGGTLAGACKELDNISRVIIPDLQEKLNEDVTQLEKKYAASQSEFKKLEERKNRIERTIEKG